MIRNISRSTIKLGPKMAKELLSKNTYEGQRSMSFQQVKQLKSEIINDNFLDGYIVTATMNGNQFLMNGQHQCRSVLETQVGVPAFLSEFHCDTKEDLVHLYKHLDQIKVRGLGDCNRATAIHHKIEWCSRVRSMVVSAATSLEKMASATRDERSELMLKYKAEGDFINNLITKKLRQSRHILKQPVAIALIKTYKSYPEGAYIFWKKVRDGENLSVDAPEKLLRDFLLGSKVTTGTLRLSVSQAISTTPDEIYAKCIIAWNLFRRSKKVKALRYQPGTTEEIA